MLDASVDVASHSDFGADVFAPEFGCNALRIPLYLALGGVADGDGIPGAPSADEPAAEALQDAGDDPCPDSARRRAKWPRASGFSFVAGAVGDQIPKTGRLGPSKGGRQGPCLTWISFGSAFA